MNELSKAIQQVIDDCKSFGAGQIIINNKTVITATWQRWEINCMSDVITICVYQDDIIKFKWQDESTTISNI
jgi:uncharacterized protein YlxW (UPF0749 family)